MAGSPKMTRTEQIAEKLISMIVVDHTFAPGERLPTEEALSKELGVSRVTLREAIRILGAQGIIETKRGIGTFVTTNEKIFSGNLDDLNVLPSKVSKELFEMRLICEPEAAYYATLRATDEELKEIREKMLEIEHYVEQGLPRTIPEQEFHNAIATATHNTYMSQLIPILNRSIEESVDRLDGNTDIIATSIADHRLIVEMIESRNAYGARAAMYVHMSHAFNVVGYSMD
jgi:GntR family transcriptional regulator, transcriptional repressor for pyruvate dehydrogenase complex